MNQKTNYYENIKTLLINNEITKRVKDYSKNKSDLETYYNVGKELYEAGSHYGESVVKQYSEKLKIDLDKKYDITTLRKMRQFYFLIEKGATLSRVLSYSHYLELLSINDINSITYYINVAKKQNLSVRALRKKIKSKEYERLDSQTKEKLIKNEKEEITDYIKHPIIIKSKNKVSSNISERFLKSIILENISEFLNELGDGFCFIKDEYKIILGDSPNYIDILLFNIKFNCYVVVELKITELKKEHIGQIQIYMNYIDKNIKTINQDKTIGIIICKKDNKLVLEYSSDPRVFSTTYLIK